MPYIQDWSDPNTGARFPASFVISSQIQIDPVNQHVAFAIRRYVSQTTYSLGLAPLESRDITVGGVAYGSWFGPQVVTAQSRLMADISVAADSYIGAATQLSGAQKAP